MTFQMMTNTVSVLTSVKLNIPSVVADKFTTGSEFIVKEVMREKNKEKMKTTCVKGIQGDHRNLHKGLV